MCPHRQLSSCPPLIGSFFFSPLTPPFPVFLSVCHFSQLGFSLSQQILISPPPIFSTDSNRDDLSKPFLLPSKHPLLTAERGGDPGAARLMRVRCAPQNKSCESFDLNSTAGEKVSASIIKTRGVSRSTQRQQIQQLQMKQQQIPDNYKTLCVRTTDASRFTPAAQSRM